MISIVSSSFRLTVVTCELAQLLLIMKSFQAVGLTLPREYDLLSGGCVAVKTPERFSGPGQIALLLIEAKGLGSGGVRLSDPVGRHEGVREIEQNVGVLAD